ncbi:hypothetical protein C4F50_15980 [Flavobacterium sp. KB82]|uniref:Uncharacterized protein n=1 Tax=Flavobacterium hungaricum TaxID=2082725 RepID=A0ABR9TM41_9FLAO|nr:hypothetical protein [Flavobacterium hungaricum]
MFSLTAKNKHKLKLYSMAESQDVKAFVEPLQMMVIFGISILHRNKNELTMRSIKSRDSLDYFCHTYTIGYPFICKNI